MSEKMRYGLLELKSTCTKCGSPLMVNGPQRKMVCGSCQEEVDSPEWIVLDSITDLFDGWVEDSWGELEGSQGTCMGQANYERLIARGTPCCRECKTDWEPQELADRPGESAWELACKGCGKVMPVNRAPDWIREKFPKIELIFNGETAEPDGEPEKEKRAIAFTCPNCSAGLKVDGTERLVPCSYCQTEVYLPDDLWLRLHPVKKMRRWYIGFTDFPSKLAAKRKKMKRKQKLEPQIEAINQQIHELRRQITDVRSDSELSSAQKKARKEELEAKKAALSEQKKALKKQIDGDG